MIQKIAIHSNSMKHEIDNAETNCKLFFIITVSIIFLLSISYRSFAQTNIICSVELEGLKHINMELHQDSSASNNYYIRMLYSSSVCMNFDMPEDNYYSLRLGIEHLIVPKKNIQFKFYKLNSGVYYSKL